MSGFPQHQGLIVGRYAIYEEFAAGGMATVHYGRTQGDAGFSRVVAIKRLLPSLAKEPHFALAFLDEAKLAARIRHPNVVPVLDVVQEAGELFLVMELVEGETLARLLQLSIGAQLKVPIRIATAIVAGVLRGLAAAHEAVSERGEPLGVVHRDVSPQNIVVGTDGVARVLDFGIAKANIRASSTRAGQIKGKLAYMAPEQLLDAEATPISDVYAVGVVLWEVLASRRMFEAKNEGALLAKVTTASAPSLRNAAPWVSDALVEVVDRATARDPARRFSSAREMLRALEAASPAAQPTEVGEWVTALAAHHLAARRERIALVEGYGIGPAPQTPASIPAPRPSNGAVLLGGRPRIGAPPSQRDATHTVTHAAPLPARRTGLLVASVLLFASIALLAVALLVTRVVRPAAAAQKMPRMLRAIVVVTTPPETTASPDRTIDIPRPPDAPPTAEAPQQPPKIRVPHVTRDADLPCKELYHLDDGGIRRVNEKCLDSQRR